MVLRGFREVDLYFTRPSWELAALRHYHELVERNLESLISARGLPPWCGDGPAPGRVAVAQVHQHQLMVDSMLPMVLRGPLLVSLWAAYESTLIEIAEFLRVRVGIPFSLLDRPNKVPAHVKPSWRGMIDRARHYYDVELHLHLFPDQITEDQIRGFYGLRNILAHAGGRRRSCIPSDWNNTKAWAAQQPGLDMVGDLTIIDADFVRAQISGVETATQHLVQQVRAKIEVLGITK